MTFILLIATNRENPIANDRQVKISVNLKDAVLEFLFKHREYENSLLWRIASSRHW